MPDTEQIPSDEVLLEEVIRAMTIDDEKITFRAVSRRSNGLFKHASDLSRRTNLRKIIERAQEDQISTRSAIGKSTNLSNLELERLVAHKDTELDSLRDAKQLLITSHREIVLIAAELGGMAAWRKFAERMHHGFDDLQEMEALPKAGMSILPVAKGGTGCV